MHSRMFLVILCLMFDEFDESCLSSSDLRAMRCLCRAHERRPFAQGQCPLTVVFTWSITVFSFLSNTLVPALCGGYSLSSGRFSARLGHFVHIYDATNTVY